MSRACALSELDDGKPFGVEVDGEPVVLVRQGDAVHALRDECSHATLALSEIVQKIGNAELEARLHAAIEHELAGGAA